MIAPKYVPSHTRGARLHEAKVVIQLCLDYSCPFSAKMMGTLAGGVMDKHSKDVCWVFLNQVQPWHPQSTMKHEASLVIAQQAPEKFWDWSIDLFKIAPQKYLDRMTWDVGRNQWYDMLAADLPPENYGLPSQSFLKALKNPDGGNDATPDLKYFTKYCRQTGLHVTPTIVCNGIIDLNVSSSWTPEQWDEYIASKK
eukprot:Clim_evm19s119 gene=Clim_evmTU19s119